MTEKTPLQVLTEIAVLELYEETENKYTGSWIDSRDAIIQMARDCIRQPQPAAEQPDAVEAECDHFHPWHYGSNQCSNCGEIVSAHYLGVMFAKLAKDSHKPQDFGPLFSAIEAEQLRLSKRLDSIYGAEMKREGGK